MNRFEVKVVRLPAWAPLVVTAVGLVLLLLAGFIGLGLLLLLSPIMLVAAGLHRLRGRRATQPMRRAWTRPDGRPPPRPPPVIDGEYQVLDERPARKAPRETGKD
jgi:hypothetical protein